MAADDVPEGKVCTKCGTADAGFTRRSSTRDGLERRCRACRSAEFKVWRSDKGEHLARGLLSWNKSNRSKKIAYQAQYRQLSYNLNHTIVNEAVRGPCYYCGYQPEEGTVLSNRGAATHSNGLDRINSEFGYEPHNVVVCCKYCNDAKNSKTLEQFRDHITRLYQNMSAKNLQVVPAFTNQTPQPVETTTTSTSTSPFSFDWFDTSTE
jgi:hypothetical protein